MVNEHFIIIMMNYLIMKTIKVAIFMPVSNYDLMICITNESDQKPLLQGCIILSTSGR